MSDTKLNQFLASGTAAERLAFTPSPATPASGPDPTYIWFETDTKATYQWDFDGAAWFRVGTPSIQTVTSSATVTPTFVNDQVNITAQAAGLTLANPSGTAVDGKLIVIRIKDNATSQTIAYGTQYRVIGVTRPTATVISKTVYLFCRWNATDTKLDIVDVKQEV